MPNDTYMGRTAPLTSKRCISYIYSTNIGTEYFKHALYSPLFSLQNAVCFIMLTCLVRLLFTFYTQGVLKLKKKNNSGAKGLNCSNERTSVKRTEYFGKGKTKNEGVILESLLDAHVLIKARKIMKHVEIIISWVTEVVKIALTTMSYVRNQFCLLPTQFRRHLKHYFTPTWQQCPYSVRQ